MAHENVSRSRFQCEKGRDEKKNSLDLEFFVFLYVSPQHFPKLQSIQIDMDRKKNVGKEERRKRKVHLLYNQWSNES